MNKKTFLLGLRLLLTTAIAGLILGAAYVITKEPIEIRTAQLNNEAMKEVVKGAKDFKKCSKPSGNVLEIQEGKSENDVKGYAITMKTMGYGGELKLMVGISKDGKVEGIKILSSQETAGLGQNASKPQFSDQFKGKSTDKKLEVVKSKPQKKEEIESLTGATITSKAVTDAVNEAVEFYNAKLKGGK